MILSSWTTEKTVINHLRISYGGPDPQAAQQRVGYLLAAAELRPAGLPPAAILCIRALRDPLPGTLPLEPGGLRPPAAWEQAARTAMEQLARQAARPARESVPAGAEAVLFADRAEVLACLARDLSDGSAYLRWWWPGLLRGADPARACAPLWLAAPEYVPAALALLAPGGHAAAFLRSLAPVATTALLDAVLHRFALAGLRAALAPWLPTPAPPAPETPLAHAQIPVAAGARPGRPAGATPPAPWAPEAQAPGLTEPARLLLAVGLLLHRAPAEVRAPAFAERVAHWAHTREEPRLAPPLPSEPAATAPPAAEITRPDPPARPPTGAERIGEPAGEQLAPPHMGGTAASPQSDVLVAPPDDPAAAISPDGIAAVPALQVVAGAAPPPENQNAALVSPPTGQLAAMPTAEMLAPLTVVETRLGGIFYLINLALFLELYSDFSYSLDTELTLNLWDFLALLGRELVGPDLNDDPLWELLAMLAGRKSGDLPGAGFAPPGAWRMPVRWLAPFSPGGTWRWATCRGWLHVYHPVGFAVIAVPRSDAPLSIQLREELQPYSAAFSGARWRGRAGGARAYPARHAAHRKKARATRRLWQAPFWGRERDRAGSNAARWVHRLAGYARARLARALGPDEDSDPGRRLCIHDARVQVTATHLDLTLELAALPLPIRFAGLDRNPGWVPAAGRYVTFYFD